MKARATFCLTVLVWLAVPAVSLRAGSYGWIETARIFLIDAYQYPFAPALEFDAEALARAMEDMHVNTVRMSTMGKYATIQGVRFATHPDQGGRDLLKEMIVACKPRGIRVVPYISTGHKLAWSMVTGKYSEYAQRTSPDGPPCRSHMYAGEDHGTVCWNTPYRQAYLELVEHVVRDYEIDGVYFDTWKALYFYPQPGVCYCRGCRDGFRRATGLELPYRENPQQYSAGELAVIDRYHAWYQDQLVEVLTRVRQIVKSFRDIPLIYNINDADKIAAEDPRVIASMDAFLYERGRSILERAEGVSLARAAGLAIWPYVGSYDNWPRTIHNGLDFQQEIFTTAMFGGGPIISQPYAFLDEPQKRSIVADPFAVLAGNENLFQGFTNYPYVAVVYGSESPAGHAQRGWWWQADVRSSSLGAFAACLYRHLQVSSVLEAILDKPDQLQHYKVLYLADIPYLSAQRIENLKRFVGQGGALIASYAVSRFDSSGRKMDRFGLEELLQVRPAVPDSQLAAIIENYQTMVGGPNDLYLKIRRPASTGLEEWPERLVPMWYYEPVEALEGGETVADVVTGDGQRPILPGVVVSRFGKGRVVYLAPSLESLYLGSNIRELTDFIESLVRLAAPEEPPYSVEGPECLIANLTQSGDTRVLHLTNWTGNKFERNWVSEYYLAPVENVLVKIRIPEGKTVLQVTSMVDGDFEHKISGNILEVFLPRVEAYQGVAVTFE